MAKLRKVTGVWRGVYSYEISKTMPGFEPVPFTLILKQGWFGYFKGSVNDDPKLGMPETGRIEGHFSFPKIEFTKLMPVCRIAMPDGRRGTLREFLIERGIRCDHDIPHKPIKYNGEFSDPQHAQGIWIIEPGPLSLASGEVVRIPGARGNWKMEATVVAAIS
jgi:hypothetical protein